MVIAGATGSSDDLQQPAADKGIPVVFTSRASYLDDVDAVRPSNMQAVQLLVKHLIRHGHQHVAWLGGWNSSSTRAERVDGYYIALLGYGLLFHNDWVLECSSSRKQAVEEMTALLHRNLTISTVMRYNETIAAGAWFGLMKAGRQNGEIGTNRYSEQRVSLAGLVDVAENALDDALIIWVCMPAREMEYTPTGCMLQCAGYDDGHSRNLTLSVRLVVTK